MNMLARMMIATSVLLSGCTTPTLDTSCKAPAMIDQDASAAEVDNFFASKGWRVLTFVGYSGAGYEDADAMLNEAERVLGQQDVAKTIVNIGATADGIGAVYEKAKARGFKTSGIVSSQARDQKVPLATCVDYVFYVTDSTWGGYDKEQRKLSPTSAAMVAASDEVIAIGGGDVARDELLEAKRRGKKITFIPADMNHAVARRKAPQAPEPREFRGSVDEAMSKAQ
jgi:hypothetical protein